MAIKHPVSGRPSLAWELQNMGIHVATRIQQAKYRRGQAYIVREAFAQIRPAYNALGLLDEQGGWVVTRNSFDEIREFGDIESAKLYVEALFALETNAE
jgi:hypothetical protein